MVLPGGLEEAKGTLELVKEMVEGLKDGDVAFPLPLEEEEYGAPEWRGMVFDVSIGIGGWEDCLSGGDG